MKKSIKLIIWNQKHDDSVDKTDSNEDKYNTDRNKRDGKTIQKG